MPEERSRRRTFGPVVLLGLAAGTLVAVAGDRRAVRGEGSALSESSSLLMSFDAHMPLATALALVVLACWGVVLVTRGRVRRAVAALGTLAAAGALAAVVAAWWQLPDQLRHEVAQLGVREVDVHHTAWYWAGAIGAALSLVASGLAVAWAGHWPEMGTRYDAPGAEPAAASALREEPSSLDLWKAMDEGRDPTDGPTP